MVDLTLRSEKVRVTKILKKTQARMFKNIEVGDVIQLSIGAERVGRGSRGSTLAADVRVDNLTKGQHTYKTFNTLGVLDNFEYEYEGG